MIVFFFYQCVCVLSVVLFANSDEFIKNLHLSSSSSPRIYVAAARVTGSYSSFHFVHYANCIARPSPAIAVELSQSWLNYFHFIYFSLSGEVKNGIQVEWLVVYHPTVRLFAT